MKSERDLIVLHTKVEEFVTFRAVETHKKENTLVEVFHEISFLFPATAAIAVLCLLLIYDMMKGASIFVGTAAIIAAVGSISFIDIAILKLRRMEREERTQEL